MRFCWSCWLLVALLITTAPVLPEAHAQNRAQVNGQVTTPGGDPLPGTQIVDVALEQGTTAGAEGTYTLPGLPPGKHVLEYRFVGYQTAVREVRLEAGEVDTVNVTLKPQVLQTEGVTVTGTARAQSTLKTPQSVDVLAAEDLQAQRSASLGAVLSESVAGVSSIKTGSQAGKPVLRGLSGNRIVLLKDGVAQEYYQFGVRHFPATNASEAERIEVVRGASSILYGSDALGGAINVLTRTTPTTDDGSFDGGGRASTSYYTNNDERAVSVELNGATGAVGARAGFERRVAGNFTTPDAPSFFETEKGGTYGDPKYTGEVPFTNFDQWSGYGQVGYRNGFGRVQLYGDYWTNRQNFLLPPGGPVDDDPDTAPPVGQAQNLEHGNLLLKGTILAGDLVLKPRLSLQRSIRQAASTGTVLNDVRAGGGVGGYDWPLDLKTDVYTARLEAAHPAVGPFSGTVGAEVQHQDADTRGPAELQPSARTWNVGAFVFEEASVQAWTLTAGVRGDVRSVETVPNQRTRDPDALSTLYATLSGALGANVVVTDGVALAANLNSGFRAPSVFERYANGVHGGVAAFQRGNPGLQPERSYSGDLSLRVNRSRLTAEVAAYVNLIRNYVYLENTGAINEAVNLPIFAATQTDAVLPGVDGQVEAGLLPWLHVGGSFSVVSGTGDGLGDGDEDGTLPLLPADKVSGFVHLTPSGAGSLQSPRIRLDVRHVFAKDAAGRYEPFAQFDAGFGPQFGTASTRAYTVVNASVRGTLDLGIGAPLTLRVGVNNLFNTVYRDFLDTYKGYALSSGRDVRISVQTTF